MWRALPRLIGCLACDPIEIMIGGPVETTRTSYRAEADRPRRRCSTSRVTMGNNGISSRT